MRQISPLEQEYRKLKRQTAPELWSRIEGNLKEHPEREEGREQEERGKRRRTGKLYKGYGTVSGRRIFAAAASAAALLLLVVAGPWYSDLLTPGKRAENAGERSEGLFAEATAAETTAAETVAAETTASAEKNMWADETMVDRGAVKESVPAKRDLETAGILSAGQLGLAEYRSLALPDGAVTAAEDSLYFSEEILGDTELLCLGTVTGVSLGTDSSGYLSLLVYEVRVDSVCYSSGYTTGLTHIQVKSPIVSAVGGESQILYQLQAGSSYVLPLKASGEDWELIFPFAPQIQAAPAGGYLFHSGFSSLINSETSVVAGQKESTNDFYYDRMLFRDDDHFLSELISLISDQT